MFTVIETIRVAIVDDHTLFRSGLRMLLEKQEDITVTGELANAENITQFLEQQKTDVILMDISLPGIDGLEATQQIKKEYPETKVIILTMYNEEPYLFKALKANASGYILKEAASTELVSAIRTVASGETFIHPSLVKVLVDEAIDKKEDKTENGKKEVLTEREKEVLHYISLGYTNQEIADKLIVSVKTVEKHKYNIMEKLNLNRRHELVQYAIKHGLVDFSDENPPE